MCELENGDRSIALKFHSPLIVITSRQFQTLKHRSRCRCFRRLCRITLSPRTSAKPLLLPLIGCQLYSIRNVCVNQNLLFVTACKDSFCLNRHLLLAVFLKGPKLVTVSVFLTIICVITELQQMSTSLTPYSCSTFQKSAC